MGKTTTIYSLLQQLLVDEKHIITFEDPIEYTLDGATQRAGMVTFREDCFYKIHHSITTIEECLRVTPDLDEPSRPLKMIIGLSDSTSDFSPCDYGSIEFGEKITQAIIKINKQRLPSEIEKMVLIRLNESGLKIKRFYTFSLSVLDDKQDRELKDWLKTYIDQDRYCHHPLEENYRCQHCNKAKAFIIPLLKKHSESLSEIVIIADDQQSYVFSNRANNNNPEWKLLIAEPSVQQ